MLKIHDLVSQNVAIFIYKFYHQLLPLVFQTFFHNIKTSHNYNTRLASKKSYYVPTARTNYGIFNIRFQGPKIWHSVDESCKSSISCVKQPYLHQYWFNDDVAIFGVLVCQSLID